MKKIFTLMAALMLCASAFAQELITFSPESGEELTSLNQTVTVSVVENPLTTSAVYAMVQPIGGGGFNQFFTETEPIPLNNGSVSFELTSEMWGNPYFENYYMQLMVVLLDEDYTPLMIDPEEEEYLMGIAGYTCKDEDSAKLIKYSPNNDWNGVTFERAYQYNEFQLFYTKPVTINGVLGTLQYFDPEGDEYDDPISISSYSQGWSDMDGLYVISFPYASSEYSANEISKIEISITGVSADNETIILTNPEFVAPQQRVVRNKKGLEKELPFLSEPVNIYTVQGSIVKKNATDLSGLQPGLYIVGSKKIVVK